MAWVKVFLEWMTTATNLDSDWMYSVYHRHQLVAKYSCSLWPLRAEVTFYYVKRLLAWDSQGKFPSGQLIFLYLPISQGDWITLNFRKWIFLQALASPAIPTSPGGRPFALGLHPFVPSWIHGCHWGWLWAFSITLCLGRKLWGRWCWL